MQHETAEPVGSATPPQKFKPNTYYPADFCANKDLEIEANLHPDPKIGETVGLYSSGAGCHFRWSMTPEGARRMAEMLCASAAEADRLAQDFLAAQAAS